MKTPRRFLAFLSLAMFALGVPNDTTFEWPDASRYWRMLINVRQEIGNYVKIHPQYFTQDKVVTDLAILDVPPGGEEKAAKDYKRIRKELESRGIAVGTYVSGTTVLPESEQSHYPQSTVSIEQMPANTSYVGSWPGWPTRKIVNIADADSRHALQANIKQLWEKTPAPIRYIDNIPAHPKVAKASPWGVSCQHMQELREMAESTGSRVMFNIPLHVGEMSDRETQQFIQAVGQNGISLEMPWHPSIRQSREATLRAQKRYRELLDSGMAIVLIPGKSVPEDQLVAWVRSWRKPTDRLYISVPFFRQPDPSITMIQ
ncbi:MAG: hypothetical protein JOY62_19350 [Acidobacteriaceae bacterium]|nr:hypothetical protein [Acidobacteriaceae bacterium]MBV9782123.1 hypothetical protein [Acidobacteriaceae bacterium]